MPAPDVLACEDVFAFRANQQTQLRQFAEGQYQVETLALLPTSHRSFYLKVPAGAVVVRVESETNDIEFEKLSAQMFYHLQLLTPHVSTSMMAPTLRQTLKQYSEAHEDLHELQQELSADHDLLISVASFFEKPFILGIDYLKQFPAYAQAVAANEKGEADERLAHWEKIPTDVRTMLADLWAGYVVMGIPDVHPYNWMISTEEVDGPRVMGLDLAMRTAIFERGIQKINWLSLMSPLGPAGIDELHLGELRHSISDGMRQRLSGLNRQIILDVAESAQFSLTDIQIEGMLSRAHLLTADLP